jgi:hypothetical protein
MNCSEYPGTTVCAIAALRYDRRELEEENLWNDAADESFNWEIPLKGSCFPDEHDLSDIQTTLE